MKWRSGTVSNKKLSFRTSRDFERVNSISLFFNNSCVDFCDTMLTKSLMKG